VRLSRRGFLQLVGVGAVAASLAPLKVFGAREVGSDSDPVGGARKMAAFPHLETEQFVAFVADNSALGLHRAGYNGVASLIPKDRGNNVFVPSFSGLNYETIELTGLPPYRNETRNTPFEPRNEPMFIERAEAKSVVLVQPETSHAHVSARITFRVEEPHYLHQHIGLVFHQRFCAEGETNRFRSLWASYMHMPPDLHVYVKNDPLGPDELSGWFGITRASHEATEAQIGLLPEAEIGAAEHLEAMRGQEPLTVEQLLARSPRYSWPLYPKLSFYYGLCHDLLFLVMFKQAGRFAFAYSPCGAGTVPAWNPAWDYVLVLDDPVLEQVYEWDVCVAVKPFQGRRDVLREVRRYLGDSC